MDKDFEDEYWEMENITDKRIYKHIIKCKKCGEQESRLSYCSNPIIFCPYCNEPMSLLKPKYIVSDNIIKYVIFFHGNRVLLDYNLLTFTLLHYFDEIPQRLLKLIRIAIKKNIPKELYKIKHISKKRQILMLYSITSKLIAETGMNFEDAKEVVSYFADALEYNIEIFSKEFTKDKIIPVQTSLFNYCNFQHDYNSSLIKTGDIFTFADCEWFVLDVKNDRILILSKYILISNVSFFPF